MKYIRRQSSQMATETCLPLPVRRLYPNRLWTIGNGFCKMTTMPRHTLLVSGIDNDIAIEVPWQEIMADYRIVEAGASAELQSALESRHIDCVLLVGPVA